MARVLSSTVRFCLVMFLVALAFPLAGSQASAAVRAEQALSPLAMGGPEQAGQVAIDLQQALGRLPLYFVENRGQMAKQVGYYLQGHDKVVYFTPQGVTFALVSATEPFAPARQPARSRQERIRLARQRAAPSLQRWAVKLDFVGANPHARPEGLEPTDAVISYFRGAPDQWRAGLPTYARIIYRDLWPGIDLLYYGAADRLKHEFIVHPGADPAQIRLAYRGATAVEPDGSGGIRISTPHGDLIDEAPVAYQEGDGQRNEVAASFAQQGCGQAQGSDKACGLTFQIGPYDPSLPLVIDPAMVVYCGYIGGSGEDSGRGIDVDGAGNAYIVGDTSSTEATFPVTPGLDPSFNGASQDVFVAKVNAAGTALLYCGYIGGDNEEWGWDIAVDSTGSAYVVGETYSEGTFPTILGPDLSYNGLSDAFVAKVNPAGTALAYSGFIGGIEIDSALGVAVDASGYAYVAGNTSSSEASFPDKGGPDQSYNGLQDTFVAKVNQEGTALVYCGYIGGDDDDFAEGIAVDGAGNAYLVGYTYSDQATFPVVVGPDLTIDSVLYTDAFIAKVNATGTALAYCGYIGGSLDDYAYDVAVDQAGNAYVAGSTSSLPASFPDKVGPDLTYNGGASDGFVAKVAAAGSSLDYCGYIGGDGPDESLGIAVDGAGNAYVAGGTGSSQASFPILLGPDLTQNGGDEAFVAKINAAGAALLYSGYIGGSSIDWAEAIAVDASGDAYLTGYTLSAQQTFPVTIGPDLTHNGIFDTFVAKVSIPTPVEVQIPLQVGWNLISFRVQPINNSVPITRVADVLWSINGLYTAVQGYDQGAKSYYPDLPPEFNDLQALDYEHGYWIKMSQAATLRIAGLPAPSNHPLTLDAGWNLVSYLPEMQITVADALSSLGAQYTAVQGFHDGGAVSYYTDLPPEFNDLRCLRPGHGYWIKATQAVTLIYPSTGACSQ